MSDASDRPSLLEAWPEARWTESELTVWRELRGRYGRENRISAGDLAQIAGIGERRVRGLVKHLVEVHRVAIASSCQAPEGYYRPATAAEILECYRWLVGFSLSTLKRASAFKRSSRLESLIGQLHMELDDAQA